MGRVGNQIKFVAQGHKTSRLRVGLLRSILGLVAGCVIAFGTIGTASAQTVGTQCVGSNGVGVYEQVGAFVVCSTDTGGSNPGTLLTSTKDHSPITDPAWADSVLGRLINSDTADDPFVDGSRTRDRGANVTSASGTITGTAQSSTATDIGGGVDGHVNASKVFNLSANQRLTIGGFFDYDSQRITYDPSATAITGTLSSTRNIYTVGGLFRYDVGKTYFGAGLAGEAGNGSLTSPGAFGSFNTNGYVAAAYVGHVFSLYNSLVPGYVSPSMPTKAVKAPPPAAGGYSLDLDLSLHLAYSNDRVGGFTDSTGFINGAEQLSYGTVGGVAKLYWTILQGRTTWSPFVAATVDSQFDYSHTLNIPAQALATADTLFYGSAQTFGGIRAGVDLADVSGIRYGVNGYWRQSSEYQVIGGQAYVKFPISQWLSGGVVAAKY